jgi:tRNA (guanine37-N1)-methyltransferase
MKRAQEKGLFLYTIHNLTDWTVRSTRRVDDRPYGGGAGTIITIEPLTRALRDLREKYGDMRILYPSPRGDLLDQEKIQSYAIPEGQYCLICGHYEGIDERIFGMFDIEEISIGEYVISSGELASLVWIDSVVRLLPGVLSVESLEEESYALKLYGKKEYPQYSRPENFENHRVPTILLSGDQKKIHLWKQEHLRD